MPNTSNGHLQLSKAAKTLNKASSSTANRAASNSDNSDDEGMLKRWASIIINKKTAKRGN